MPKLTREDVKRRLQELSGKPVPNDLDPGAMCYSPAPPPSYWVFICPTCGRRTAYILGSEEDEFTSTRKPRKPADAERRMQREESWRIAASLEVAQEARKLPKRKGLRVDASALCAVCRPAAKRFEPILEVQLPDDKEPRRIRLKSEDVELLRAFLAGKDRYDAGQGSARPLQDELARLKVLLLGARDEDSGDGER